MSLLDDIEKRWTEAKAEALIFKWAEVLKESQPNAVEAGKKFRSPLKVYLPAMSAKKTSTSFSLRYQGQEVARLDVRGNTRLLNISTKRAEINKEYFGIDKPLKGKIWEGSDAIAFRKHFKDLAPIKKVRSPEHSIEAEFLKQMAKNSKFLKNIQPVLFAGCPFQFPLPISGNTGLPVAKAGHVDILARRGIGNGTNISIWELKSPNVTGEAIAQVYIYAVTLIKMLRSKSGSDWYKIIGFNGKVPKILTIEGVVAVCINDKNKKSKFIKNMKEFKDKNFPLNVGNDRIKLLVAYYTEKPLKVDEPEEI